MKFLKYLLLALALPISAFAQRTNQVDNLWVPTSLRFTPGAAAGRVFTSDAIGLGSWSVLTTTGTVSDARYVIKAGFSAASPQNLDTDLTTTQALTASNLTITASGVAYGFVYTNMPTSSTAGVRIGNEATGAMLLINNAAADRMYIDARNGLIIRNNNGGGSFLFLNGSLANLGVNMSVDGNSTLGDAASDITTLTGTSVLIPNNLNIGSGTMVISNAWGAGVNTASLDGNRFRVNTPTTSVPSADTLLSSSLSNRVTLYVQATPGQVSNIVAIGTSAASDLFQFTTAGRFINATGGNSVSSPSAGSSFGGTAINGINLKIISSSISTNLVIDTAVGQTTPFLVIESTNGTSFVQVSEDSFRVGTNGTPYRASISANYTVDPPSIPAQATFSTNVTWTGAKAGMPTMRGSTVNTSNIFLRVECTADNVGTISWGNIGAAAVDPANQTVTMRIFNE